MDTMMKDAQLVTVPVLDARLSELRSEMNTRFAEVRAEMNTRFSAQEARMDVRFAQFETRFATLKTDLIVWILVIVVGNNYLPQLVSTLVETLKQLASAWA